MGIDFGLGIIKGISKILKASSVLDEGHCGDVEMAGVKRYADRMFRKR
jgi:hypothetical protein